MHFPLLAILAVLGLTPFLAQAAPTSPKLCDPQVSYDGAMNAVFTANKEHYPYIRAAAREFDMCDRKRFAAFVGQIAHETGRLTTLYQPKDDGAGALHMLPRNWKFAFQYLANTHPDLVKPLAGDYTRTDAVASKIMQSPEVAYIVAGWWFDSGASYVLHNKCTGMSKFADKLSDDGKWTNADDDVMSLIGSCIFGMDKDEGAPQRREFIKAAFGGFVVETPRTTTTTLAVTTTTTKAATTTTVPVTTTTASATTTDATTASTHVSTKTTSTSVIPTTTSTTTEASTTTPIPGSTSTTAGEITTSTATDATTATSTESKTETDITSTTTASTLTKSYADDETTTTTTTKVATATQSSSGSSGTADPTHAYGKRPTKPGKPVVEPTSGTEPQKPNDQEEPVYGKRPETKPTQAPAKCY